MHGVRQEFRRSQQKHLKPQQSGPRGIIYYGCIDPQQLPLVYLSGKYGAEQHWIKGSLDWESCHQRLTGQRLAVPPQNTLFAVALLLQRFDRAHPPNPRDLGCTDGESLCREFSLGEASG